MGVLTRGRDISDLSPSPFVHAEEMPHEYTAGRQPSAPAAGDQEKVAKLGVTREPSGPELAVGVDARPSESSKQDIPSPCSKTPVIPSIDRQLWRKKNF